MNSASHSGSGKLTGFLLLTLLVLVATVTACSKIPFAPATVVPTKASLPYTATVELATIGAYVVQPGATMSPDPNLQNRITAPVPALTSDKEAWEQALVDYVVSRRTFRTVVKQGASNIRLAIRMLIYIDPSLGFKSNTIYVARAAGTTPALHWVPAEFLERHNVSPWMDMPVWVPGSGDSAGFARLNTAKALGAGLRFRPAEDTARATLAWWRSEPEERRRAKLRAGLAPEREAQVLAEWRKRGGSAPT